MSANKRFLELLDELKEVHTKKSAGYAGADNTDAFANFRLSSNFGVTPFHGCLIRLSDKYSRIGNIVSDPKNEMLGETVKDNLLDLASYALIAYCLYEEENES
jgi:hypothetical protein